MTDVKARVDHAGDMREAARGLRLDMERIKREHKQIQRDLSEIRSTFQILRHIVMKNQPTNTNELGDQFIHTARSQTTRIHDGDAQDEIAFSSTLVSPIDDNNGGGSMDSIAVVENHSVDDLAFFHRIVDAQCKNENMRSHQKDKVLDLMLFPPERARSMSLQNIHNAGMEAQAHVRMDRKVSMDVAIFHENSKNYGGALQRRDSENWKLIIEQNIDSELVTDL